MWFAKSVEETLEALNVNPGTGLSLEEAERRKKEFGLNKLEGQKRKTILQLFLKQLKDALIYVLFGAVVITLFMGEYVDAIIILMVILINAILGVTQEVKAGNAIEALRKLSAPKALVKRNGEVKEIESEQIVPGDILILDAGRLIAADLRLIESANMQIDESSLTGESVPSKKDAKAVLNSAETPLGDRVNLAFMSTMVTYGRGVGVVVDTGMKTEVGKIADIIDKEVESPTPLHSDFHIGFASRTGCGGNVSYRCITGRRIYTRRPRCYRCRCAFNRRDEHVEKKCHHKKITCGRNTGVRKHCVF
jgi:Ca2+-transporting ATPase